jgi:putative nucleotidyltransferase with HDIG domain
LTAIPTREQAWELLTEYNKSEALRKHALAVEGVMRYFARKLGEDENYWGIVGLLHDIDYEKYPDRHCVKCVEILKERGYSEPFIRAVVSHGYGICSDVAPESQMEKVLYATDELTGLINAAAIMRPSKSVLDLELKSLKKKYKTLNFAAGVNREVIEKGAEALGADVADLMQDCILAMREVADDIGLRGSV